MATTTGFVQKLTLSSGPITCMWVGADPAATELLFIIPESTDTPADRTFKSAMSGVLAQAMTSGRLVEVTHGSNSAAATAVALPRADTIAFPLQMDSLEVTQAVQDRAHSVPLVAGKRTVVRAYLSYYGGSSLTVSGQLIVRSAPGATPMTIASANVVTLNPANAGDVTAARNDASRSLNFVLPSSATVAGQLAIRLSRVTNTATGATVAVGSEARPVVGFQPGAPLRVHIVRFSYAQGTPPVTFAPSNVDYNLLVSWLGRAYPASQVIATQAAVAVTAAVPFGSGNTNAQLAALRTADVNAGADNRTHYYGLVSDGGFFMRGSAAGIPSTPDPTTVASGPTGPGTWGWDNDGSYGDWYGGHELGHTFGRLHPGFCGESQDDLDGYPFANGQLSTSDSGFGGFDVGDPGNGIALAAYPGSGWHDVMTYRNTQWLSPYTYEAIRRRLIAEDALPSTAGAGAGAGGGSRGGAGGAGGRPDERYPERAAVAGAGGGPGSTPTQATAVSVVAEVNLTKRVGSISFVNPVPNLAPTQPAADSPVSLRVASADGKRLGEYPVQVLLNSELGRDDDRVGLVNAVLVAEPGAAVIELVIGDQVVDTFRAGGAPPVLKNVRAVPTGSDDVRLVMDLAEPVEEGHSFNVQVSTDHGETWRTVGVGLLDTSAAVDRSQFERGEEVYVRVTATNGFTASVVTSEPFRA